MKINDNLVQALSTEKSSEPERAKQEKAGGVRGAVSPPRQRCRKGFPVAVRCETANGK